jgi:hypothetical protein
MIKAAHHRGTLRLLACRASCSFRSRRLSSSLSPRPPSHPCTQPKTLRQRRSPFLPRGHGRKKFGRHRGGTRQPAALQSPSTSLLAAGASTSSSPSLCAPRAGREVPPGKGGAAATAREEAPIMEGQSGSARRAGRGRPGRSGGRRRRRGGAERDRREGIMSVFSFYPFFFLIAV